MERRTKETERPEIPEGEAPAEEVRAPAEEVREVARGRATRTPFVIIGGVATLVWTVAAIITAAVLLIWWLG